MLKLSFDAGAVAAEQPEFPLKLPPNPVLPENMRKHYRLPEQDREVEPLRTELRQFTEWMAEPVQMDRKAHVLSDRTVKNIHTCVLEYLGFCKAHLGVNLPRLSEYVNMFNIAKFVSFHIAKGNSYTTIAHLLGAARKVLSYLGRQTDERLGHQIVRADEYTSRMTKQLARIMAKPRTDIGDYEAEGTWMSAPEVVKLITAFKSETEHFLPEAGVSLSLYMARMLHDACLACCMFGYMPPIRLCVLRTLQLPTAVRCLHPDCRIPDCKANKLDWRDGDLYLVMTHFKVQNV